MTERRRNWDNIVLSFPPTKYGTCFASTIQSSLSIEAASIKARMLRCLWLFPLVELLNQSFVLRQEEKETPLGYTGLWVKLVALWTTRFSSKWVLELPTVSLHAQAVALFLHSDDSSVLVDVTLYNLFSVINQIVFNFQLPSGQPGGGFSLKSAFCLHCDKEPHHIWHLRSCKSSHKVLLFISIFSRGDTGKKIKSNYNYSTVWNYTASD